MNNAEISGADALEAQLSHDDSSEYVLRLFIAGTTSNSLRAISNIKRVCEERLNGRYKLEVVDVYQQPELVAAEQVVAAPTLIKKLPLPLRRLIGDLSDEDKIIVGLNLLPR